MAPGHSTACNTGCCPLTGWPACSDCDAPGTTASYRTQGTTRVGMFHPLKTQNRSAVFHLFKQCEQKHIAPSPQKADKVCFLQVRSSAASELQRKWHAAQRPAPNTAELGPWCALLNSGQPGLPASASVFAHKKHRQISRQACTPRREARRQQWGTLLRPATYHS